MSTKKTDIFLCYRRAGAQTAKLFQRYLESIQFPASVWYSDSKITGNYKYDIPDLLNSAKCAVLFVDEHFTKGFVQPEAEEECITALEVIEIEKRRQRDPEFHILMVTLDCKGLSLAGQKDLRKLFEDAGVCQEESVPFFALSNTISFLTARDDEYLLFEKLARELTTYSLLATDMVKGNFYFGSRSTAADIVVWDADNGIACSDISFTMITDPIPLYRNIEHIRCPETNESQNNAMVSLTNLEIQLSDNDERAQVMISYKEIDYRLFRKTLNLWDTLNLDCTLRFFDYKTESYMIPNAMGLAFMVVTADQRLIFSKRSAERGIRPNQYDCSVVEGLRPKVTFEEEPGYDIFSPRYVELEILRAFTEEISPNDQGIRIKVNGIVLDKEYGQWNIVGTIFSPETAEALMRKHSVRKDSYEKTHLEAVPFCTAEGQKTLSFLKAVLPKFFRHNIWSMALATLYGTLRNLGFSESEIDQLCP